METHLIMLTIWILVRFKDSKYIKTSLSCSKTRFKTNYYICKSSRLYLFQVVSTFHILAVFKWFANCSYNCQLWFSCRHHVYEKPAGNKSIELKEVGPRFELRLYQVWLFCAGMDKTEIEFLLRVIYIFSSNGKCLEAGQWLTTR